MDQPSPVFMSPQDGEGPTPQEEVTRVVGI